MECRKNIEGRQAFVSEKLEEGPDEKLPPHAFRHVTSIDPINRFSRCQHYQHPQQMLIVIKAVVSNASRLGFPKQKPKAQSPWATLSVADDGR
jgi:hypothetical protein